MRLSCKKCTSIVDGSEKDLLAHLIQHENEAKIRKNFRELK